MDEEEVIKEIDRSDSSSDCEDDNHISFKCCKCKKVYHTRGWLRKHEESCSGPSETTKSRQKVLKCQRIKRKPERFSQTSGLRSIFPLIVHLLFQSIFAKSRRNQARLPK